MPKIRALHPSFFTERARPFSALYDRLGHERRAAA